MLVDTHCHLGDAAFDDDRAAVVSRAADEGVAHVVIVADSAPASTHARRLAEQFGFSATAGVHPHEASSWSEDVAAEIAAALDRPEAVAVGETGLDYHYDYSPRPAQRAAFDAQLALAAEKNLPVVVHAREADDDMAAIVREWGSRIPALVLHSFSSGRAVFDAGMEVGAYFGWSGMVTFKNWKLTDLLAACPPDRLLLETDAPYLAPVPHRGKRNEPAYVARVANRVAEVHGLASDALAEVTTANAVRCFGRRIITLNPPSHE